MNKINKKISSKLLKLEIDKILLSLDYDFIAIVNTNSGAMELIKYQKVKAPSLLGRNAKYDNQLSSFIEHSVLPIFKKEASEAFSLKTIKSNVDKYGFYALSFPINVTTGEVKYKRWNFIRFKKYKNIILFTRKDITEGFLGLKDPVTALYTLQKAYVEGRKILDKYKDTKFIVLYADIDDFITYNNYFGTEESNALLAKVGQFLNSLKRPDMVFARISADCFFGLVPENELNEEKAQKYWDEFLQPLNENFYFVPRIGIYRVVDRSKSFNQMASYAYYANRSLKGKERKIIAYYDDSLLKGNAEYHRIVIKALEGIKNKQFEVYYQPIVDSRTNKVISAEALTRWNDPTYGLINPGLYIPILEKVGLINTLDEFVLEEVCAFQEKRINNQEEVFPISLNLSRQDLLNKNIAHEIKTKVDKYNIPLSLIRLEITESAYFNDSTFLTSQISLLKKLGFYIEMDDFGSGYSSLSMLKDIPIDLVKLDMKFFDQADNPASKIIVSSLANLLHGINKEVIAEGVEDIKTINFLHDYGINFIQGYYFSKPIKESEFISFIKNPTHQG